MRMPSFLCRRRATPRFILDTAQRAPPHNTARPSPYQARRFRRAPRRDAGAA